MDILFMQRILLYSIVMFLSLESYGQYTDIINSNKPGRSMGA